MWSNLHTVVDASFSLAFFYSIQLLTSSARFGTSRSEEIYRCPFVMVNYSANKEILVDNATDRNFHAKSRNVGLASVMKGALMSKKGAEVIWRQMPRICDVSVCHNATILRYRFLTLANFFALPRTPASYSWTDGRCWKRNEQGGRLAFFCRVVLA